MVILELIDLIKTLADENRLRILNILRYGEFNVGDMEKILDIRQSNISRHLNKLIKSELIKRDKKAQWVFYSLNNNTLTKYPILQTIIEHELDKVEKFELDIKRLKEYFSHKNYLSSEF